MLLHLLRRLGQSVLVLLAVSFISFMVFRHIGDPTISLLGEDASVQEREALTEELGFNQSVPLQYLHYAGKVLHGDLGISYRLKRPVADIIAERLPATLELALTAALFALAIGVALGVYTALRRDGFLSRAIMTVSLVGVSLPTFLIGIGLIYLFAVELRWLPSFGRGETVKIGGWETGLLTTSGLAALIMPAITLGFYNMTLIMRLVRAEMLEVLRSDYIRFGRARGLRERDLYFGHALRNTLIPVITIAGLQIGSLIAFAIVTETVFQWPGVGLLFISSIQGVDVPLIAAYLMFIALLYVVINLFVDFLYVLVDPRLRKGTP
ncbi:ABC transporter permease [Comamonas resistens]|uniref:ABC transporter permease n=1 Tax=Comamonas resistens TaxID=3046670 RepID=A0ABY8SUK5_9BURK|nr:ABC transporter permease [Comamonas resistens]MDL5035549.1 ABC transporter permease [Comamonas resistens]WHS64971.1 ABC transporter permease [Comamonas resistens]